MSGLTCVFQTNGVISQSRCIIRWGKGVRCRMVGRLLNVVASLSVFVSGKWRKSAFTGLVRLHSDVRCPKTSCSTVGIRTGSESGYQWCEENLIGPKDIFKEYNGMSRPRTYNARPSRKHALCVGTWLKWVLRGFGVAFFLGCEGKLVPLWGILSCWSAS